MMLMRSFEVEEVGFLIAVWILTPFLRFRERERERERKD